MNKKEQYFEENFSHKFSDTQVLDPETGKMILFKSIWENNLRTLTIIRILRRFGCAICRMASIDLTDHFHKLEIKFPNAVSLVGLGLAKTSYEEFKEGEYLDGNLYIDEERNIYKALSFKRFGIFSFYGFCNCRTLYAAKMVGDRKIKGDYKGPDNYQLGGTYIIDNAGEVVYMHKQKDYFDHPTLDELSDAIRTYLQKRAPSNQ